MNEILIRKRDLAVLIFLVIVTMFLAGCVGLPPAVQESVKSIRSTVAELHNVHAQDARSFAAVVNEREYALKEADQALRLAFREKLQAQIEASKTRVLAEYDRRASDLLGVELTSALEDRLSELDELERKQQNKLSDALRDEAAKGDDPVVRGTVRTAEKNLAGTRSTRERLVGRVFLSRAAALSRARFKFQDEIDQRYAILEPLLNQIVSSSDTPDRALRDFNDRTSKRLSDLDAAYNSIDQALSDVSTYIDSEAIVLRFATHFLKGAGAAMVDDLKNGQMGAAALSELLTKKEPDFVNQLKQIEKRMSEKASQTADDAAGQLTHAQPPRSELVSKTID